MDVIPAMVKPESRIVEKAGFRIEAFRNDRTICFVLKNIIVLDSPSSQLVK